MTKEMEKVPSIQLSSGPPLWVRQKRLFEDRLLSRGTRATRESRRPQQAQAACEESTPEKIFPLWSQAGRGLLF